MGGFGEKLDNYPLWGYKSEIIDGIKNGEWHKLRKFSITKEDWEEAVREGRREGRYVVRYGNRGGGKPWTSNSMVINESGVSREWKRLPDSVKEKIKDWYESTGSRREYSAGDGSFVEFRYLELVIEISNRGNPQDVYLEAWFKDH